MNIYFVKCFICGVDFLLGKGGGCRAIDYGQRFLCSEKCNNIFSEKNKFKK